MVIIIRITDNTIELINFNTVMYMLTDNKNIEKNIAMHTY